MIALTEALAATCASMRTAKKVGASCPQGRLCKTESPRVGHRARDVRSCRSRMDVIAIPSKRSTAGDTGMGCCCMGWELCGANGKFPLLFSHQSCLLSQKFPLPLACCVDLCPEQEERGGMTRDRSTQQTKGKGNFHDASRLWSEKGETESTR